MSTVKRALITGSSFLAMIGILMAAVIGVAVGGVSVLS